MTSKHTPRNVSVMGAAKVTKAIGMRLEKHTYDHIAAVCGYANGGGAYNAVKRELDRRIVHKIDELRREEAMVLDAMQQVLMPLAIDKQRPDFHAMDRLLMIMERRARLFGLDMKLEDHVVDTNYTKTIILQYENGDPVIPPIIETISIEIDAPEENCGA